MKRLIILLLAGYFAVVVACNTTTDDSGSGTDAEMVNPNGSSELAVLMRQMYDAAMHSKKEIIKGQQPEVSLEFEKILTAAPTDSALIDYPEFEPLAKSYISAMKQLDTADMDNAPQAHMTVVSTCKSCHTISCQGPMQRIKKLDLPEVLLGKD